MARYLVRRLWQALLALFGILLIVFVLARMAGDPVETMAPLGATSEEIQFFRHRLGLDKPIVVQFVIYIRNILMGNLGTSLRSGQPAMALVLERLPATLQLALASLSLALLFALVVGTSGAVKPGSLWDSLGVGIAILGQALPVFWLGILLILAFSVHWHILPTGGRGTFASLLLPATTLALFTAARTARLVRASMGKTLALEFIRTARAKGLPLRVVVLKHAFPYGLAMIVPIVALDLGALLGGAVITETVFAWPGLGRLLVNAVYGRDYPVIQAAVIVIAITYALLNLVSDVTQAILDPRIRLE